MTKQEYAEYQANVESFFEREGLNCLTAVDGEEYFSRQPCDCCGTHLGGSRQDAHGFNDKTKEIQEGYIVCTDCLYYAEYGQLDDMTMLEIEDSE